MRSIMVTLLFGVIWLVTVAALVALSPDIARLLGRNPGTPSSATQDTLPPLPDRFFPTARMEFTNLFGGIKSLTDLQSRQGGLASVERTLDESYLAVTRFRVTVPRASTTLADLETLAPELATDWPGLETSLPSATISPFFHSLYERKLTFIEQRLTRFRHYPSRHNFFDCQTILELTHPGSNLPLLLVQADMDVVTDGSDGDRVTVAEDIDSTSRYFQPFTAYNWAKTTNQPNPLLERYQSQLDEVLAELETSTGTEQEKMPLYEQRNRLRKIVEAMKYRSSLVAHLDPFIVLPGFIFKQDTRHTPKLGDYCIVFYKGKAYPAIVGDVGPNSKIGEASLLLARTLNPEATGFSRPVSQPAVTYLIFPGSREDRMQQPDLSHWQQRCRELIDKAGGLAIPLHDWTAPVKTPADASGG